MRKKYSNEFKTEAVRLWQTSEKAQGISCSENRVARLMQTHGIRAKQVKRKKVTTKANGAHPVAIRPSAGDVVNPFGSITMALCAAGIAIKIEDFPGLMHNKFMVIDAEGTAPPVVTGRMN